MSASQLVLGIAGVLLSGQALPGQRTWIVDFFNRPGTDFTEIQPAVDAAISGDVIRVRGTGIPVFPWDGYQAPTIDAKGVTLIGDGATESEGTWLSGLMRVRNIAAGQVVRLTAFRMQSAVGGWFRLESNQGMVVLQDLDLNGPEGTPRPLIQDCALVTMSRCDHAGFPYGIEIVRSNVMMDDCALRISQSLFGVPGTLSLDHGRLWLRNTTVIGQSYNPLVQPPVCSTAIRVVGDSELFLAAGTTVEGGICPGGRGPAVLQWNGVPTSHVDPGAVQIGSIEGIVDGRPVTSLRSTTAAGTLMLDHTCTPSSLVALAVGPLLPTPWSGPEGVIAVDPLQALTWFAFVPSGQLMWTFPMPPGLPPEFLWGMQGIELRPDGTLGLTNVTMLGGA